MHVYIDENGKLRDCVSDQVLPDLELKPRPLGVIKIPGSLDLQKLADADGLITGPLCTMRLPSSIFADSKGNNEFKPMTKSEEVKRLEFAYIRAYQTGLHSPEIAKAQAELDLKAPQLFVRSDGMLCGYNRVTGQMESSEKKWLSGFVRGADGKWLEENTIGDELAKGESDTPAIVRMEEP